VVFTSCGRIQWRYVGRIKMLIYVYIMYMVSYMYVDKNEANTWVMGHAEHCWGSTTEVCRFPHFGTHTKLAAA